MVFIHAGALHGLIITLRSGLIASASRTRGRTYCRAGSIEKWRSSGSGAFPGVSS